MKEHVLAICVLIHAGEGRACSFLDPYHEDYRADWMHLGGRYAPVAAVTREGIDIPVGGRQKRA